MENKKLPENLSGVHIHFVGIKGTGMAALVEIFYHNGSIITGSDVSEKFYTDEILSQLKIIPTVFSEDNITKDIQYVVYSSAYKIDKNPELIKAVELKIPCLLYSEALGQYSNLAYSCGVCGVHGKTSTTGLAGTILSELDLPSQVLAGSVINSFGGKCTYTSKNFAESASKKNSYFVAETCEYQRHFMSFCPQKIILTSVESDHQDYYPHYEDIRDAFVDYICKLPKNGDLIYCIDDKGCVDTVNELKKHRDDINLIPYGFTAFGDYRISELKLENEKQSFNISCLGNAELSVPGKHEVLDSVAAVALI
ncbi:MAG: UDP-N-acetylmuramate--L-alanine ligase, partial [Treponema sp.]|nr:UDP-N-acetylmuramate--L-alanine ligase [Treponema sp.]